MAISVVMPALEMAQDTGKLIAWLKNEGDNVIKGEPLLEIETDKAVMEIESPGDGILAGISAGPGTEVAVGKTIAWIVRPGEVLPSDQVAQDTERRAGAAESATKAFKPTATAPAAASEGRMSPKARRLAKEHGVELGHIQGTGPGGEILASDVLAAVQSATTLAATSRATPGSEALTSVARRMAERMTQSWTTIPHFFLVREIDASALNVAREQLAGSMEKSGAARPSHTDLLVALVARALAKHPPMNSSWSGTGIVRHPEINVAIAIAVDDGVVAPVIRNTEKATLAEITAKLRELTERARTGKLRPADLTGATFTISNLGMFGVDAFTAIITPGQGAVLAVGRTAERVIAIDGKPTIRPMMTVTLSSDHRVVDGARAALFLQDLAEIIYDPFPGKLRPPGLGKRRGHNQRG